MKNKILDIETMLSTPRWRSIWTGQKFGKIFGENTSPAMLGGYDGPHVRALIENLAYVLHNEIHGDVIELGCNNGGMSNFFKLFLDQYGSDKKLYLYDSFEGLPQSDKDKDERSWSGMKTRKDLVLEGFKANEIPPPHKLHKGWFKDLTPEDLPQSVAFAFYDGDLYESIHQSLEKTYHLVSVGGIIAIHDYGDYRFPGVKQACFDFLGDEEAQRIYRYEDTADWSVVLKQRLSIDSDFLSRHPEYMSLGFLVKR